MSVTGNFASINMAGKGLTVSGNSAPPDPCELMSRHVAVSQGKHFAKASDELLATDNWSIEVTGGDSFSKNEPVLAVGVETYLLTDAVEPSGDQLPSFVTLTWSQIVHLT
jgi:hypothetical protein